ncbi:MAG: hypothetical protein DDT24_00681 [Chloroflexi bacterium]|nr:hypothetical protein [Chloroflexota bacterium]
MQTRSRDAQSLSNPLESCRPLMAFLTEDVDHYRWSEQFSRAQRKFHNRPNVLLELRSDAGLYGIVPRIMRPGGDFVHQDIPRFA